MRPVKVKVGPLANSNASNIATSQTPASGTATATITSGNPSIAATNSFVAGQIVTFTSTGTLNANLSPNTPYYVIATGLSGSHFEVATGYNGPAVVPGAGSGTQTVVYTNNPALNGSLVVSSASGGPNGVAVLDTGRRILITTTDTTTIFTLTGTDPTGNPISESFIVSGGASYSQYDYTTLTSVTANQGPTAALTIGTNGVASSAWVGLDEWANSQIFIQIDVTGNCNYTLQFTGDTTNSTVGATDIPANMQWLPSNDLNVVNATTSQQTNFLFTPTWARVLMNSGNGTVTAKFIQPNVASR